MKKHRPGAVTFIYSNVTGEFFTANQFRRSPKTGKRKRGDLRELGKYYGRELEGRAVYKKRFPDGEYRLLCTYKMFKMDQGTDYELVVDLDESRNELRLRRSHNVHASN